jgi:hypothetical protein
MATLKIRNFHLNQDAKFARGCHPERSEGSPDELRRDSSSQAPQNDKQKLNKKSNF